MTPLIVAVIVLAVCTFSLSYAAARTTLNSKSLADAARTIVKAAQVMAEEAQKPHCPLTPLPCPTCTPDDKPEPRNELCAYPGVCDGVADSSCPSYCEWGKE